MSLAAGLLEKSTPSRSLLLAGVAVFVVSSGIYFVQRLDSASADVSVAIFDPRTVELEPAPLRPGWILDGHPVATAAHIDETHDGSTHLMVWRVSAGRFNWYYDFDETVAILDGEVYLTGGANAAPGNPAERRLGPGDVVFFHYGSAATWRVPDHVLKVATVRRPLPGPLGTFYRIARQARNWLMPQPANSL
jgi:uncharacterized cupin superfamily protein